MKATKKQLTFVYMLLLLASFARAQEQQINLFPITDVAPEYPTEAIIREIEGWVLVSFDVSALGSESNIEVRDSEPRLTFDDSAINAITEFEYAPYDPTEGTIDRLNVFHLFKFRSAG